MNTEQRKERINELCDEAGCSDKIRKIHFDQFVHRSWHPHPPQDFVTWWKEQPDCKLWGIDAKRAYNCVRYVNEFMEAKQYGAA